MAHTILGNNPQLLRLCSVDYYEPWPKSALEIVARSRLTPVPENIWQLVGDPTAEDDSPSPRRLQRRTLSMPVSPLQSSPTQAETAQEKQQEEKDIDADFPVTVVEDNSHVQKLKPKAKGKSKAKSKGGKTKTKAKAAAKAAATAPPTKNKYRNKHRIRARSAKGKSKRNPAEAAKKEQSQEEAQWNGCPAQRQRCWFISAQSQKAKARHGHQGPRSAALHCSKRGKGYFWRDKTNIPFSKLVLQFLGTYTGLLQSQVMAKKEQLQRLELGLQKLAEAEGGVESMGHDMDLRKVELEKKSETLALLLDRILGETSVAESQKARVESVRSKLQHETVELEEKLEKVSKELAEAKPALVAAREALGRISPSDMNTLRSMRSPPDLIKRILDAVLVLRHLPLNVQRGNCICLLSRWKDLPAHAALVGIFTAHDVRGALSAERQRFRPRHSQ